MAQFRLDGVRVAAGAFTNLTHDHLDYHGDEVAYLAAKSRMFSEIVADGGTAVINADIPEASGISALITAVPPSATISENMRDFAAR